MRAGAARYGWIGQNFHVFCEGGGRRWLDNAVTHIYRELFTYGELKALAKFYCSSAGQKMTVNFPILMMQSMQERRR